MKTINSILRVIFTISLCSTISTSCLAQSLLSNLNDGETAKAINQKYKVKKTEKYITIENINNKFTNVKQNSPKLFGQLLSYPEIVTNKAQLNIICAKYMSRQQIETLASGDKGAGLMIIIRTDIYGKTMEVGFFTEQNSILTLQQLEQMENEIIKAKVVTINPKVLPFLEGSNFWQIRPTIFYFYNELLKVKLELENSKQEENN